MRILHVYKGYPPVTGGMENHLCLLAEAQAAAGHDVTVLVTASGRRSEREVRRGVRVVRAGRWATLSSAPLSIALARVLRAEEPDLTHLHCPYPVGEAAWLAWGRRPMVLTYQSDIVRQRWLGALWAPGLRRVLDRADRILASSPPYVESSPFLRPLRHKVTVVPLGIDPRPFVTVDRAAARGRLGDGPTLLFVGRLRYYKGLEVLIDALSALPDVRLAVVGTGPMGDTWRRRAETHGVSDRITWLGDVAGDALPLTLAAADVFVLPSTRRSEAYGLAMVEAMATGLPVISTELGTGTSWVNQDGVTGRVVAPGDARALATAVRELVGDAALRRRMGEAGRARVVSDLSAERMIERVQAVYADVLGGTPE